MDLGAVARLLDELLWVVRRVGVTIAPAQAIDVVRAVRCVGLEDRETLREAIAAVVVTRAADRLRFDAAFDRFFAERSAERSLWDRLAARGVALDEIEALRELLAALGAARGDDAPGLPALLHRGAALDGLLAAAGLGERVPTTNPMSEGFVAYRILESIGVPHARRGLVQLEARLRDALGDARARAVVDALAVEISAAEDEARRHVRDAFAASSAPPAGPRRVHAAPFNTLSVDEREEVRAAVRRFVARLRGGARVRARRAKRGRIDPHRTLRRALRTGGVPVCITRRRRHHDKPRLWLLCDVSDSVRPSATFLLEFMYAAQSLFQRTRSFVFVSDIGECTAAFSRELPAVALAHAYAGGVVPVHENSNYGRALRAFERRWLRDLDRKTTVVILGDGRTNYHDHAADVLDRVRERARALLWLCPEGRGEWASGDSAMPRYAPKCTRVFEVRCARDLELAARALVGRR